MAGAGSGFGGLIRWQDGHVRSGPLDLIPRIHDEIRRVAAPGANNRDKSAASRPRRPWTSRLAAGADMVGFVLLPEKPALTSALPDGPGAWPTARVGRAAGRGADPSTWTMRAIEIVAAVTGVAPAARGKRDAGARRRGPRRAHAAGSHEGARASPSASPTSRADAATPAVADRLLLEAKPPKGARPTGRQRRDLRLDAPRRASTPPLPYLLVRGARRRRTSPERIRISGATGVDVSSGVETCARPARTETSSARSSRPPRTRPASASRQKVQPRDRAATRRTFLPHRAGRAGLLRHSSAGASSPKR